MIANIIGNGRSRMAVDLDQLTTHGPLWGCNALYRDCTPQGLTAVDPPMIDEIIESGAHHHTYFCIPDKLTQYAHVPNVTLFPTPFEQMDSGTMAALVAISEGYTELYLWGFDYVSPTDYQNNVYSDTPNYRASDKWHVTQATLQSWFDRAQFMVTAFPNVEWIRINGNNFEPPIHGPNWHNIHLLDQAKQWNLDLELVEPMPTPKPVQQHVNPYAGSRNPSRPWWYPG